MAGGEGDEVQRREPRCLGGSVEERRWTGGWTVYTCAGGRRGDRGMEDRRKDRQRVYLFTHHLLRIISAG